MVCRVVTLSSVFLGTIFFSSLSFFPVIDQEKERMSVNVEKPKFPMDTPEFTFFPRDTCGTF